MTLAYTGLRATEARKILEQAPRLQASPELRGRSRLRHRRLPILDAPEAAKKNPGRA